jgi:two-component system OmpR family response regulator
MEHKRNNSSSLRILIVEDHADTADSMAMLLRLFGHDVVVAGDGPTALQLVDGDVPDVVLLDLALPKMNGWQIARQIRSRITGKRPLLIAITGYGDQAARSRSSQAGIDLHLIKPVDPEMLEQVLQRFETVLCAEMPA